MKARRRWRPCPQALELLAEGGPFDTEVYRHSWTRCFPEWRDVSFGAESANGTRAAVSLFLRNRVAVSPPYNYGMVVATRQLGAATLRSFLESARAHSSARRLIVRSACVRPTSFTAHLGGRISGWTSVVHLGKSEQLESRFAQKARRSMRLAQREGAEVIETMDPEAFLCLYAATSTHHWLKYPDDLIRLLARNGVARFFNVELDGDRVASVMVLISRSHWMAWLAAQDEVGRRLNANYLAVGKMLAAAQRQRVGAVNLGISLDMPGVGHFKRRFDSVDAPLFEYRVELPTTAAKDRAARFGERTLNRLRRRMRLTA